MTIGQLAERLGLNPRTIRYYERIGLVPEPERGPSGYRLYRPEGEERLRFIKSAQHLGLTLAEVKEMLAFRDRGERPCAYVAEVIERRLDEVNQRLRELGALRGELEAIHEQMAARGTVEEDASFCYYIEAHAATRQGL